MFKNIYDSITMNTMDEQTYKNIDDILHKDAGY